MGKIINEFREFAVKGNMTDMAVGVIIGGAFKGIVDSLVNDIIMPVLSVFTGKLDFSKLFVALDGQKYATIEAAEAANAAIVRYGSFITGVLNFIIMAFVVFMIVKFLNAIKKKDETPAAPATKKCPHCMSEINIEAKKCPFCTSDVE